MPYNISQFEGIAHGAIYSVNLRHLLTVDLVQPTVLMLYPKDFTPVCTSELIEAKLRWSDIADTGVAFYAGSTDSPETHEAFFAEIGHVPYPVLTIAPRHKLLYSNVNYNGYCDRVTLFIAGERIIGYYKVPMAKKRSLDTTLEMMQMLKDKL